MRSLKGAVWTFTAALVLSFAALTFVFLRGEDTRSKVERVTIDPCARPPSKSCQKRIRLVLKQLARQHPGELRKLGLVPRDTGSGGVTAPLGGDAGTSPSGGGPIGRVPGPGPSPGGSPPADQPSEPPAPGPLIDLDAPVPLQTCVDGVLGVNC